MRKLAIFCVLVFSLMVTPVFALSLSQAKSQGLVGEQRNGYLGIVVSSPSSDVKKLVNEVNQARKKQYEKIAQQNKTSLAAVEQIAGKTAIGKTTSGNYVQSSQGQWVKKP